MVPNYGHKSSLIIEMVENETHIASPPQARILILEKVVRRNLRKICGTKLRHPPQSEGL